MFYQNLVTNRIYISIKILKVAIQLNVVQKGKAIILLTKDKEDKIANFEDFIMSLYEENILQKLLKI